MARDAKYQYVQGIGTLSPENQAKLDSIDKIQEQLTGQSFDETSQTTNFGQDVELTVPQLPVTDLATQGLELASTQRVQDMLNTTVAVVQYKGLASIGIPFDTLFAGMTPQEALNAIVSQATIQEGDKRWDYSMDINSTVSTLEGIFGSGYLHIFNIGDDHHEVKFFSDDDKVYFGSYNEVNAPRLSFRDNAFMDDIDGHHPTTIIHDIAANQPTAVECKEVFELIPNHDFAEDKDFYIKNSARDRVILVHYFAQDTSTQANPGNYYYEVLNLAV